MYLGKTNFLIIDVASVDLKQRSLCGLHIADDGTTVASDGMSLMVVEPVDQEKVVFESAGELAYIGLEGVTIDRETVDRVLKNMPKDLVAQVVAMTENEFGRVEFMVRDRRTEHKVAGRPFRERFAKWRSALRGAFNRTGTVRICLSRKRLIKLLTVMDKACPDPTGHTPVFLEIGGAEDPVIVRSVNQLTGQRVIAMFYPHNIGDEWLPFSEWEERLFGLGLRPPRSRIIKRRRK